MLLKELFLKEDDRSTAVFAFGRFNPPTIGHQKLIQKVQDTASKVNGKGFIFLSHSQNNKTDPLTLKWVLKSRGKQWVVDTETLQWILKNRNQQWVLDENLTKWTFNSQTMKWVIK